MEIPILWTYWIPAFAGMTIWCKGSLNNKFAILSVEALGWQGANAQEYQAYFELSQRSQVGCIGA